MCPDNTTLRPMCTGGDVITTSCSAENNRFKHSLYIQRERDRLSVMGFNGPGGKGVHDLVFISTDLMSPSMSRQMQRNSIALYWQEKKKQPLMISLASLP